MVDYIGETRGNVRLPGVMMLGYVAAHSESLAMAVIVSRGVVQLAIVLSEEEEDHIRVGGWVGGRRGSVTVLVEHTCICVRGVCWCMGMVWGD